MARNSGRNYYSSCKRLLETLAKHRVFLSLQSRHPRKGGKGSKKVNRLKGKEAKRSFCYAVHPRKRNKPKIVIKEIFPF